MCIYGEMFTRFNVQQVLKVKQKWKTWKSESVVCRAFPVEHHAALVQLLSPCLLAYCIYCMYLWKSIYSLSSLPPPLPVAQQPTCDSETMWSSPGCVVASDAHHSPSRVTCPDVGLPLYSVCFLYKRHSFPPRRMVQARHRVPWIQPYKQNRDVWYLLSISLETWWKCDTEQINKLKWQKSS